MKIGHCGGVVNILCAMLKMYVFMDKIYLAALSEVSIYSAHSNVVCSHLEKVVKKCAKFALD